MKIFLHFGQNKAGSSFIQKILNKNRILLRNNGYEYPEHALGHNGISSGHQYYFENISLLSSILKKVEKADGNLILSSEYFFTEKEKFKNLIDCLPGEKYIVGFFRHPLEHFNSNYSQGIKVNYDFKPYCSHYDTFNYKINMQKIFTILNYKEQCQVSIESYDQHLNQNKSILPTFLRNIHLPEDFISANERVNSSYSIGTSAIKKIINRVYVQLSINQKQKYEDLVFKLGIALQKISDESYNISFEDKSLLTEKQKINYDLQINNFNEDIKNHHIENLNIKYEDNNKVDFSDLVLLNEVQKTIEVLKSKDLKLFIKTKKFIFEHYPLLLCINKLDPNFFVRKKNLIDLFKEEVVVLSELGVKYKEIIRIIAKADSFEINNQLSIKELRAQGFFNELHKHMLQ